MCIVLKYRYKLVKRRAPYDKEVLLPIIPVRLKNGEKSLDVGALLDSGADFSAIPVDMAEVLGVRLGKPEPVGGIGGDVEAHPSRVTVVVLKAHERYEIEIPVMVLPEREDEIQVILGRPGFFERFDITFKERDKTIVLKPR